MPATYNKFNNFVHYLTGAVSGQHISLASDTIKVMLVHTTAPLVTNTKYADISANEVASGNNYVTGGATVSVTSTNSSGIETVATTTGISWTATGGSIGPFEWAVFYDSTPTDQPLICWFDYGSAITLAAGESFTIDPNSATTGTLFTLA